MRVCVFTKWLIHFNKTFDIQKNIYSNLNYILYLNRILFARITQVNSLSANRLAMNFLNQVNRIVFTFHQLGSIYRFIVVASVKIPRLPLIQPHAYLHRYTMSASARRKSQEGAEESNAARARARVRCNYLVIKFPTPSRARADRRYARRTEEEMGKKRARRSEFRRNEFHPQ